jgi:tetratricopeptide (TPR) repeat protein
VRSPAHRVLPLVALGILAGVAPLGAHPGLDWLQREVDERVADHPADPAVYLDRARVYELAQEWPEALRALAQAAAHGADRDEVEAARGRVLLHAGRPERARREFDRVLRRRPDAHGLRLERARAWVKLGNLAAADADFAQAIARMPSPTPEHVLERRDALLARGKRAAAIRALDAGMDRIGTVPTLQLAALDLEVALGRHAEALRRIDTLLAQSPRQATWVARRGDIFDQAGRHAEARAEYVRALGLLEGRPRHRRGKPLRELEDRLRAALTATERRDSR